MLKESKPFFDNIEAECCSSQPNSTKTNVKNNQKTIKKTDSNLNVQRKVTFNVTRARYLQTSNVRESYASWIPIIQSSLEIFILGIGTLIIAYHNQQQNNLKETIEKLGADVTITSFDSPHLCSKTCKIEIVESVPQNLTFTSTSISMSTFDAWLKLISGAKHQLVIAAYKSSLRGKHVLGNMNQQFSSQGELIYDAIVDAGLKRHVAVRIIENSPSKDKGDNEDAIHLHKIGAVTRKTLNLQKIYNTGVMHSKFIIADSRHFYLGSANLDWRSLNQKMELGVYVSNCPCMAKDLTTLFDIYWRTADAKSANQLENTLRQQTAAKFNASKPLKMQEDTEIYLASSPRFMNSPSRSWDLNSIVDAISSAKHFVNIHVMDYIPMFMYGKENRFWPAIDNAIRKTIMRGVDVKIIAAALHYPNLSLRFLESLEMLGNIPNTGSINVRILKIPSTQSLNSVIKRDRRTHKKFLVTDTQVIIGTSNWSGDYFDAKGTGTAIVIRQNKTQKSRNFIEKMRSIFNRDWESVYAHPLQQYIQACLSTTTYYSNFTQTMHKSSFSFDVSICEPKKDSSLFASTTLKADS